MEFNDIKNKKKLSNIIRYLMLAIVFVVITIFLYNAFLLYISKDTNDGSKYIFGMQAYVVETNSMEPELKKGDILIVRKVDPAKLEAGQIITFTSRGELITHRISSIDKKLERISTKGDKNSINDVEKVKYDEVRGVKVLKLPDFWRFVSNARNLILIFIFFVILIALFLHNRRSYRKRKVRRLKKKKDDKKVREYDHKDSKNDN